MEVISEISAQMEPNDAMHGRSVTFYVDNNDALSAMVKNSATPIAIHAIVASYGTSAGTSG